MKRIYKVFSQGNKLSYKCVITNTSEEEVIKTISDMFDGRTQIFKIYCNDIEVARVNGKRNLKYKKDGKIIDRSTGDLYTFEDFMDMHGYGKAQAYCMIKNSKLYDWQTTI